MRIAAVVIALLFSVRASADLAQDLASCGTLTDATVRLACFDSLAKQSPIQPPAEVPSAEPVAAPLTLATDMRGWRKGDRIALSNGETWQCFEESKFLIPPALKGAAVSLRSGFLGSTWMRIEGIEQEIRVAPVR